MARDDDEHDPDAPAPWHNSTAKVFGASIAGVAGIGLIVGSVIFVSQRVEEPTQAPLNFVEPSFSQTSAPSRTSSTPSTTAPPRPTQAETTDIDLPPPSDTSPTSTPSSSAESTSSRPPTTTAEEDDEGEEGPTTTRKRPRFNETRTLYPQR
ncbi:MULTISPECIES: hypothetical protein [Mycobacteriaceae]|uniref:hypothetical protein n=1 Tax=Mycobacteriaceae TaxID=1762 RepID=UPI000AC41CF1|nr:MULTISPECIES: hypothetical protein [Mycobacteriaceae]MCK0175523.1 hypothetical protein [Mycolicibacterium sp. F2034L]